MSVKINEPLFEEKLEELEKSRSWNPRVISKLENFIRNNGDYDLYRVNPLTFGAEKHIPVQEAIDLFLFSVKIGLFQMEWHLMCPECSDVIESLNSLTHLTPQYYCKFCSKEFEAKLDDYIVITFTISPQIREISYHFPDNLSAEDYIFKYSLSKDGKLPGGARVSEMFRSIAKIIDELLPGEKKQYEIDLAPGILRGFDYRNEDNIFLLEVKNNPENKKNTLSFAFKPELPNPVTGDIQAGPVCLEFENLRDKKVIFSVQNFPEEAMTNGLTIEFDPFLNGKMLLTSQTFRNLFRSEVVQAAESISIQDITILFTDLKGSTALYDRIGDMNAYALVRQHFDSIGKVITTHSGAIIKTIGDAVMAAFLNPVDGLKAAIEMLQEIEQFNKTYQKDEIILKIGLHKGGALAVTLNERLDFFGQSVNIASRVQNLAGPKEIYITEEIYNQPGIRDLLKEPHVQQERKNLKGLGEEINVYRIMVNNTW